VISFESTSLAVHHVRRCTLEAAIAELKVAVSALDRAALRNGGEVPADLASDFRGPARDPPARRDPRSTAARRSRHRGQLPPGQPSRAVMDHVLDWKRIHRTEDDMNRLFEASKFGRPCDQIRFEAERINLFAIGSRALA
jgi:hypothetical protein